METKASPLWLTLVLGGLVASGLLETTGCGLLIEGPETPHSQVSSPPTAFFCEAEIYREVGVSREFTEAWQLYAFPPKTCSAGPFEGLSCATEADCDEAGAMCTGPSAEAYCAQKLDRYESDLLAPGLGWQHRDFQVTEIPLGDGVVGKAAAVDCPSLETVGPSGPPGFGAPCGNELVLAGEDASDVFVRVRLTLDGTVHTAEPAVASFALRFAERTGLPARPPETAYRREPRGLRFGDFFLELETPFSLGPVTVNQFYIQSIGTILAEDVGAGGFRIFGGDAKFYLAGSAAAQGETGDESFCFTADGINPENVELSHGAGGVPFLGFGFSLFPADGLQVDVGFSTTSFDEYQPFVLLADRPDELSRRVTLAPLVLADPDPDPDVDPASTLWFEDFEGPGERFLGQGAPLSDVLFDYGSHTVSAVAYDARGCSNTSSMTLTITNLAPSALDDAYELQEDAPLEVAAPGVLANDGDANPTDVLGAVLASGPLHGSLALHADGSFRYEPERNYAGPDAFMYVASDGALQSSAAAVSLTVVEVPTDEEIERTRDKIKDLVEAGILTPDQANALDRKLVNAEAELKRAHPNAERSACGKLLAFVHEVQGLVADGTLTEEQGQDLIDDAERDYMVELGC